MRGPIPLPTRIEKFTVLRGPQGGAWGVGMHDLFMEESHLFHSVAKWLYGGVIRVWGYVVTGENQVAHPQIKFPPVYAG